MSINSEGLLLDTPPDAVATRLLKKDTKSPHAEANMSWVVFLLRVESFVHQKYFESERK